MIAPFYFLSQFAEEIGIPETFDPSLWVSSISRRSPVVNILLHDICIYGDACNIRICGYVRVCKKEKEYENESTHKYALYALSL